MLVSDHFVKFALLEAEIISSFIILRECFVDELKACIHNLVALDSENSMSIP